MKIVVALFFHRYLANVFVIFLNNFGSIGIKRIVTLISYELLTFLFFLWKIYILTLMRKILLSYKFLAFFEFLLWDTLRKKSKGISKFVGKFFILICHDRFFMVLAYLDWNILLALFWVIILTLIITNLWTFLSKV